MVARTDLGGFSDTSRRAAGGAGVLSLIAAIAALLGDGTGCSSSEDAAPGGAGSTSGATTSAPPAPPAPDLGASVATRVVSLPNARGAVFHSVVVEPKTPGPHPSVVVLHGSGGLHRMPKADEPGPCSASLEPQFERWAMRLASSGFAVMMPDSFASRGYCDDNDDRRRDAVYPAIAGDEDGKTRRLLDRIYDLDAAVRHLAALPNVRADAVALLGFSNGASTVAVYTHHRLAETLASFATSADGRALGVSIPTLPSPAPALRQAVAYYPGCGFDGIVPMTTDPSDVERFFYPRMPLRILHGSADSLVDHCSITRAGTRERQADGYASAKVEPDRYDITVYEGARHGFDAECDKGAADPDGQACQDALRVTMELFAPLAQP